MKLRPGDAGIQPARDLLIDDASKIAFSSDLKNDHPVVLVERADVAQNRYYLAGGPFCLNDPERHERPTPIGCAL